MRYLPALRLLALIALAPLAAACSMRRTTATPAPDLSGAWDFDVDVGTRVTHGAFTLERRGDGYGGELTTDRGPNRLPVRSVTLARDSVAMVVESPDGIVTFRGVLAGGATAMSGMMAYHNGRLYPMTVRRRASQGS